MTQGLLRRGLRLIGRYARTHPLTFTIAVASSFLFAAAAVGSTLALRWVTDELVVPAFEEGGGSRSVALAGVIFLVGVVRAIGVVGRRYFGAMTTNRLQVTWRTAITDQYLVQPMSWYQEHPTGELLAHADADVEGATAMMRPLPFALGVVALIAFSVASLALLDPLLMLVGLALFPALGVLNHIYTRRVERPAAAVQRAVGDVSTVAHESFDGVLAVKTLGRESAEVDRLAEMADELRRQRLEVGKLRAFFEPTLDALPSIGSIALLVIGAWRIDAGLLSTGELVQAMALFGILAFPVRIVGYLLEELPRSVVSMDRIDDVLATPAPVGGARALTEEGVRPVSDARRTLPDGPLSIEAAHLSFGYESEPVLDDVSLRIEPGETVAVVGTTGSGKSTLSLLLAGLLEPSGGAVLLGGIDLAQLSDDEVRDAVAIVFQETFLFADSIRGNVTLGRPVDEQDLAAVLALVRADAFVRALPEGLDTVIGERGVTLSGGQRQRLALARALVRRPRVLLLDDATSAVDPRIESEILAGLRRDLDTTLLVVAHRVSTILLADRVLLLDAGRIVASGTHDDLLARSDYEALVRAYERTAR